MERLFRQGDLRDALVATADAMSEVLQRWNHDALLTAPVTDVIEDLVDRGSVHCPELVRNQCYQEQHAEAVHTVRDFDRDFKRRVPQITLVVPYVGERRVFDLRASTGSYNSPCAVLSDVDLRLVWEGSISDAAQVKAYFDAELGKIERHLSWSRKDIDEHNRRIVEQVPVLVARRREELLTIRSVQAEIGFPIRRRNDANTYSVPVARRRVRVTQPRTDARHTTPFKPEPVLLDSHYGDALAVLTNARNALERSPGTAAKLSEEKIRDLLLVSLNAQFEGQAGGELFNGGGKTDILIRVEDRNVFIGECKIWKGPKTVDDALGQLFTYLVWRDTKAALLLFIRNADVTTPIVKAIERIEAHPHYKRRGRGRTEERHDFVMHAAGDPNREIHLAFLPFALPSRKTTR